MAPACDRQIKWESIQLTHSSFVVAGSAGWLSLPWGRQGPEGLHHRLGETLMGTRQVWSKPQTTSCSHHPLRNFCPKVTDPAQVPGLHINPWAFSPCPTEATSRARFQLPTARRCQPWALLSHGPMAISRAVSDSSLPLQGLIETHFTLTPALPCHFNTFDE